MFPNVWVQTLKSEILSGLQQLSCHQILNIIFICIIISISPPITLVQVLISCGLYPKPLH